MLKNVFRCIVRHANKLEDRTLIRDLRLKALMRKSTTVVRQRQLVRDLFLLEKSLRDALETRSTTARVRSIFMETEETGMVERNQRGSYGLYMQHPMRRFDNYNLPQNTAGVHRQAQFANRFYNFAHKFNRVPNVDPNAAKVRDPEARKWSVIMGTILAPYMESQKAVRNDSRGPQVRLKTIERNSHSLPVLQISGSLLKSRGFKRHLADVNADSLARTRKLDERIKAAQAAKGKDAKKLVDELRQQKADIKKQSIELADRLEVQRRILLRRQREMQTALDYERRRRAQNKERKAALAERKLLSLDKL